MHRNEDDQTANVAEMRSLVGALGLDLVSVWPEAEPTLPVAPHLGAADRRARPRRETGSTTSTDRQWSASACYGPCK